jgi:hypothetical protein
MDRPNYFGSSSAAGRVGEELDRPARKPEPERSTWGQWLAGLFAGTRRRSSRQILANLCATETRLARQLTRHAQCLSGYSDASGQLLALAARSESDRELLAHTLERLGGRRPSAIPNPRDGQSNLERLLIDRDDLTAVLHEYLDSAYELERDYPDLTVLLLAIRERRARDRQALLRVLAGFDSLVLDRANGCAPGSAKAEAESASYTESARTTKTSGALPGRAEPEDFELLRQPVGMAAAAPTKAHSHDWEDPV